MKTLNKRLWRMIRATKGQFIAVTVVLAIGLVSYTSLNMTIQNLDLTVSHYYDITNFADVFGEVMRMPQKALDDLAKQPGVEMAMGNVVRDVKYQTGSDERATLRIVSYNAQGDTINQPYLIKGTKPQNDNEIMLLQMFASARNLRIGSQIEVIIAGKTKALTVCGIVANPEYIYLIEDEQTLLPDPEKFGVGYVTERFAQNQFNYQKSYNHIYFRLSDDVDVDDFISRIEKKLNKYGLIRIYPRADQMSARMIYEEITQGKKSANVIPLIFLAVAAFIIAVMIGRIVKNDRMTIGVLKAMGYGNRQIVLHYTKYALGIGVIGAFVGILLGVISAGQMAEVYTKTVYDIPVLVGRVYPEYIILGVILGSGFCIGAGLYGARGIIAIHPAESMRPEAPKSGKRILLERLPALWRRINFGWKVVIRNMLRSKWRVSFLVLGIALTYAITLAPLYMLSSFYTMFDEQYGKMYKMDYTLSLTNFTNRQAVDDIKGLTGAQLAEGQIEFPFEISRGWKKKIVNIIGVERASGLYQFTESGQLLDDLPKNGIVLNEGLARLLGVKKGDYVTVSTFIPDRDDIDLRISAVVEQHLGVNAYMNITAMQKHLLDAKAINGIILKDIAVNADIFDTLQNVKSAQSLVDLKDIFKKFTTLTMTSIGVMVVSSGILGFAIVYNSTVISINERKLEFSSLRVMGFDKTEIFAMIAKENALVAAVGIALGIPLGAAMLEGIAQTFNTEFYSLKVIDNPLMYVYAGLLTALFVVIALGATYGKITRLDFMDALKARIT